MLLPPKKQRLSVLIGEFGFGKTTAALRAVGAHASQILYVPAARISEATMSAKDVLQQCVDTDELLADIPEESRVALEPVVRPVLEYILKREDTNLALILDGLDESEFLASRGRMQWFFNTLYAVRVPIILIARTEIWNSRLSDFATSFGQVAVRGELRNTRLRLIELLPWTDTEIGEMIERYRDHAEDDQQREYLADLFELVAEGRYESLYGDIPRRPLFLRFIVESVSQKGVHEVGRARLFEEWVSMKISRDLMNPIAHGGQGRVPIVVGSEGLDATIDLSWFAMELAAAYMTKIVAGGLELSASCNLEDVLASHPRLGSIHDAAGLVLNSLLIPVSSRGRDRQLSIRFAHRAFQEVFLARFIRKNPARFESVVIPGAVKTWIADLEAESL